jgi:hypothetical protein
MLAKTDSTPAPQTPAQIAAGVQKSSTLKLGQLKLAKLFERCEEILEEQRRVLHVSPNRDNAACATAVRKLEQDRIAIEKVIGDARRAMAGERAGHAAAVAQALAPVLRDAAARVVHLLGELHAALAVAHDCERETHHAGGEPAAGLPGLAGAAALEIEARRLAGPEA